MEISSLQWLKRIVEVEVEIWYEVKSKEAPGNNLEKVTRCVRVCATDVGGWYFSS
jgi:hypothetical protein